MSTAYIYLCQETFLALLYSNVNKFLIIVLYFLVIGMLYVYVARILLCESCKFGEKIF